MSVRLRLVLRGAGGEGESGISSMHTSLCSLDSKYSAPFPVLSCLSTHNGAGRGR